MAKLDTLKSARGLQTADIEMHFLLDSEEGTNEVLGPGNEHRYRWYSDDVTTGTEMARLELVGGTVELFVYGALNVSGITTFNTVPYTWPGADAAGQLQSDGAGNLSWAAGTTEVNDLSAVVTWANVPDANITESSVTQHEAALAIAFSQVTGTVPATQGGTGQTVYTVGDILYASTTTALTPLIAGTATHVLTSNGAGVAPSWQAVGGGTPGGSTTEIQYNLAGAFAGSSTFTLDGSGYLNVPRIIRGGSGHTKAGTYNANATIFDGGNSGATSLGGPATQTGWMMRLWGSGNFGTSSSGFGIENTAFWVNTSGTSFNTYVTGTLAMQVDAARTYIRDSVSAFSGRALAIYRQDLSAWATLSSGTGATTIGVDTNFQDNIGLIFGASGADAEMKWSGTSANDALHFGVNVSGLAASSANLNIVNQVYIDNDFDRPIATDPTVNIFSATDPDTNNTQYLSLTHNQTDGVIEVGTGAVSIAPATGSVKYRGIPYTWPASDSTGSQALQSNGSGVLSWVSVPNGADYLNKDGSVALTADWDAGSFDIRAATLTADGLTSGRVVYASTNGLLTDSANLTFDGTELDVTGTLDVGPTGLVGATAGSAGFGNATEYMTYDALNVTLKMVATNPGNNGPRIEFHHNRASPAAFDKVTEFYYQGEDSGGTQTDYGRFRCEIASPTAGSERARMVWTLGRNGTAEDVIEVTNFNAYTQLALTSADPGSTGVVLETYHNTASPLADDVIYRQSFFGEDSASNKQEYARIDIASAVVTSGSERGTITMFADKSGTLENAIRIGGNTVFNTDQDDRDTRMNTVNVASALQVDAGDDRVDFNVRQLWGASITPSLTGNTNNWNPSGLDTANVIMFTSTGSYNLTGISAGDDGDMVILFNNNTSGNTITLTHNDGNSTGANQFFCPNATSFTLPLQCGVMLRYTSAHSGKWQVISDV